MQFSAVLGASGQPHRGTAAPAGSSYGIRSSKASPFFSPAIVLTLEMTLTDRWQNHGALSPQCPQLLAL